MMPQDATHGRNEEGMYRRDATSVLTTFYRIATAWYHVGEAAEALNERA
jgi:hypothetical protein